MYSGWSHISYFKTPSVTFLLAYVCILLSFPSVSQSFSSHGHEESEMVKVESSLAGCRGGNLENPYLNNLASNTSTVECQLLKQGVRVCRAAAFTYGMESIVVALIDQFAISDMQALSFWLSRESWKAISLILHWRMLLM